MTDKIERGHIIQQLLGQVTNFRFMQSGKNYLDGI